MNKSIKYPTSRITARVNQLSIQLKLIKAKYIRHEITKNEAKKRGYRTIEKSTEHMIADVNKFNKKIGATHPAKTQDFKKELENKRKMWNDIIDAVQLPKVPRA